MPWTIVAIPTRADSAEAVLQAAGLIAKGTGNAQIEIVHVRHDPMEGFLPSEEVMTRERRQAFEAAQEQNSILIKAVFDRWAPSQPGPKPSWREVTGSIDKMVGEQTKHADIVVVQHPGSGGDPDLSGAIHTLLFQSRLLTLLADCRSSSLDRPAPGFGLERVQVVHAGDRGLAANSAEGRASYGSLGRRCDPPRSTS